MLEGTWIAAAATLDGQPLDAPAARLTVRGQRYVVEGAAGRDEGGLVLDTAVTPATLDLRGERGPNAGQTLHAICRVRGDRLELCYRVGGGDRPASFGASAGAWTLSVRYRREAGAASAEG